MLKSALLRLRQLPLYQENLNWGKPRRGHPEGTLANHIHDLEQNLERVRHLLGPDEEDRLRLLIHVHDICKPEAWVGVDSDHPQNHAFMARRLLEQICDDPTLLAITQFHDDGYTMYQYFRSVHRYTPRLRQLLCEVGDVELFMLFFLVDSCTAGKHREPVDWWLHVVHQERALGTRVFEAFKILLGAMT
ncbi:MAG: hypothetical protein U0931_31460 [Vulcanimicrobiota bacterium]